jgi:hypothetical protein
MGTGPDEVKAKNLARNARCILTTGCNAFRKGLDVVVEGEVGVVTDEPLLRCLVAIWKRKVRRQPCYLLDAQRRLHRRVEEADVREAPPGPSGCAATIPRRR